MMKLARVILEQTGGVPALLRVSRRGSEKLRREFERTLHDGPALRVSALALELALISGSVSDPKVRDLVVGAQDEVCRIADELREVGGAIYPPLLVSAGVETALRAVAERQRVWFTIQVDESGMDDLTRTRLCLLLADHLRSLPPGTALSARVRGGRHLVRVRVREWRGGRLPRQRWAVLRCA
ncbi:hypothetical protein V1227_06505 [Lentzea sp. DG1S-22]|uniref:hypothetical protein n=1 Tax=Lentzea sp. DG1S-22 TaxID=3108822 RepID=UPI002E7A0EDD|nr:hypothetical protein [Lentzea sp. DG1S-22]WVH82404.1 hypothetical protein V1227_06505 [Lentzea sp. DG1S-22]